MTPEETHGISYINSSNDSVFTGIVSVVLSTWSLEGPQPLLLSYLQAIRFRTSMISPNVSDVKIISAEQARTIAAGMSLHVRGIKPKGVMP